MDKMGHDTKLLELGISLPEPPRPLGSYSGISSSGNLVFLSGMLPLRDGVPAYTGSSDKEEARAAAELATLNALAILKEHFITLDRVGRVVRLAIYIATDRDFSEHAYVADGSSQLLNEVFSGSDPHARLVFGVSSLPKNAAVEIELIFELADQVEKKHNK